MRAITLNASSSLNSKIHILSRMSSCILNMTKIRATHKSNVSRDTILISHQYNIYKAINKHFDKNQNTENLYQLSQYIYLFDCSCFLVFVVVRCDREIVYVCVLIGETLFNNIINKRRSHITFQSFVSHSAFIQNHSKPAMMTISPTPARSATISFSDWPSLVDSSNSSGRTLTVAM